MFAGVGLFTAWDPYQAKRRAADWVAVQLDPEGGTSASVAELRASGFKKVFGWEARASQNGVQLARVKGCDGYIGQAESDEQAQACLALKVDGPKAVIGNPGSWTRATFDKLAADGWDLILEWYWNAQPAYLSPNAANYPRFVNVCFGCYDASGETPTGRRVPLSAYLAVWHGSWSVYLAETMTEDDWSKLP